MLNTLSGRFLILTTVFVMLAEILIFVPSISRFRLDYLADRLERAQIASLALLADDMLETELEAELLENAGVFNVVLRRDEVRQLVLSSPIPAPISGTYDLRMSSPFALIGHAMQRLVTPENQIIRVIGAPVRDAGLLIEITIETDGLRAAMIDYGVRILLLSAVISIFTAVLLFAAVRRFMVKPIKGVIGYMQRYAAAPEDARGIIHPTAGVRELREAEEALMQLQTELTQALKQRERLAQLGGAVAKVSHDLRNILTSAQLFTDRIEMSEDPLVRRLAPKLVNSITRAVSLCEGTLAFGRAEEPAPTFGRVALHGQVEDILESESLAGGAEGRVRFLNEVPVDLSLRADPEQLFRIVMNLVRNARQAIEATGQEGQITLSAREDTESWWISVADTGPGLPPKARENLFTPFQGGIRKGGTGLGLAIADELARGHGGMVVLRETGPEGTVFDICLPKGDGTL
ncbi:MULTISPECIES: HAMP domain-containing sensor histidine kinase [Phaeobacter]|uniref:histidine kinase n=1 Tax=Phaeobacter piscinae TaxID=1580596 RepID=A0AAN1GTB3_9RHOB|nr:MULTISPECIES: HAMP domain-containing sensor histidine kinase [Phaeobacter]ATG36956.1 signal transduction histidine kinase [Phaeobacter piscinae]ATG40893.1 signal transduction histidine kinase [Phaeobacter piscinae]ATG44751.1 signal transduction histidine kinase [Phaeobacter piscinae]AUQ87477.1 signal transduction histidine kinase [Phaeobacter piscinae]AUR25360.1 signal transduction histidine kinase [Phaeobacter piscinae]